MNIFETLWFYLQFQFVQYALVVAILTAICASLIGVPVVLKRYSFIGFGLSNVAFMVTALAIALNLENQIILVMPLTVLASILLLGFGRRGKVKGDASIAMLSLGALAIGYFIINTFAVRGNVTADIAGSLFGATSILTLQLSDVLLSLGVTLVVATVFIFLYKRIFAVTFDANFMQATGSRPLVYEILIATVVGIVVALSMQLVGALLTSALIIFPTLSAMRIFRTYKSVTIASVIIAVICALFGIFLAIIMETPVGVTIIIFNLLVFAILCLVSYMKSLRT